MFSDSVETPVPVARRRAPAKGVKELKPDTGWVGQTGSRRVSIVYIRVHRSGAGRYCRHVDPKRRGRPIRFGFQPITKEGDCVRIGKPHIAEIGLHFRSVRNNNLNLVVCLPSGG